MCIYELITKAEIKLDYVEIQKYPDPWHLKELYIKADWLCVAAVLRN
jgi:hypothetical protein